MMDEKTRAAVKIFRKILETTEENYKSLLWTDQLRIFDEYLETIYGMNESEFPIKYEEETQRFFLDGREIFYVDQYIQDVADGIQFNGWLHFINWMSKAHEELSNEGFEV